MKSGGIKTLFVHGTNPIFEVPKSFGFSDALKGCGTVISFATFADETAVAADYVFPDRHGRSHGVTSGFDRYETICSFGGYNHSFQGSIIKTLQASSYMMLVPLRMY